jgi:lactoylglutathione lyase
VIIGLGHVAYKVKDLDESLEFYCGKLGLKEAFRLNHENGELMLVYLKVVEGQFIELFPGGIDKGKDEDERIGFKHLCLHVDDIFATLEELKKRGLEIKGQPMMGADGNYQYWIEDPDGNRIELMQIMPGSLQDKAKEL